MRGLPMPNHEPPMPWFPDLCRNVGLMLHHIVKPAPDGRKHEVRRTVEEKTTDEGVTLRRTTIEEIEFKPKPDQRS